MAAAPAPGRPLHAVRPDPAPADQLLDALARWAGRATPGPSVAVLQVSDGEVQADFPLDDQQAAALAAAITRLAGLSR